MAGRLRCKNSVKYVPKEFLKPALDAVFIPNLDISMRIRIAGLKRVTKDLSTPGTTFVAGLNSAEEAWPGLEVTGKEDIV